MWRRFSNLENFQFYCGDLTGDSGTGPLLQHWICSLIGNGGGEWIVVHNNQLKIERVYSGNGATIVESTDSDVLYWLHAIPSRWEVEWPFDGEKGVHVPDCTQCSECIVTTTMLNWQESSSWQRYATIAVHIDTFSFSMRYEYERQPLRFMPIARAYNCFVTTDQTINILSKEWQLELNGGK